MLKLFSSSTPSKKSFLVASYGGCGSKFLVKQIAKHTKDRDFEKYHSHLRHPTIENMEKYQYPVFLYCDPVDAIISFFHRREKITKQHGFVSKKRHGDSDWVVKHCKNIGGDFQVISKDWDLERFIQHGVDLFKLDEFVYNWLEFSQKTDILFIKYELMWENLNKIKTFLSLDNTFVKNFEKQKQRTSKRDQITEESLNRLQKMYIPTYIAIKEIENR